MRKLILLELLSNCTPRDSNTGYLCMEWKLHFHGTQKYLASWWDFLPLENIYFLKSKCATATNIDLSKISIEGSPLVCDNKLFAFFQSYRIFFPLMYMLILTQKKTPNNKNQTSVCVLWEDCWRFIKRCFLQNSHITSHEQILEFGGKTWNMCWKKNSKF